MSQPEAMKQLCNLLWASKRNGIAVVRNTVRSAAKAFWEEDERLGLAMKRPVLFVENSNVIAQTEDGEVTVHECCSSDAAWSVLRIYISACEDIGISMKANGKVN